MALDLPTPGEFNWADKLNDALEGLVEKNGAALPADATDLASAVTLVNALRARLIAAGLGS